MKLNSPWKALLWEEFGISGFITFFLLLVSLSLAFFCKFFVPELTLYLYDIEIFTYALPGLNGLLILLLRGNFGELRTGFQKRIFYLPVNTFLPVTLILFFRFGLLLFHVVVLRSICIYLFLPYNTLYGYHGLHDIFDHELLINMAVNGGLFLFLQFFVWLFHYSKSMFSIVIVFIISLIYRVDIEFFSPYSFGYVCYVEVRRFIIDHPVEFLIISIGITYPLSLILIKCYRHNIVLYFSKLIPDLPFIHHFQSRSSKPKTFKSDFSALLWYELNYHKLFLLKWTFLFWLAVNLYFWFDVNQRYRPWRDCGLSSVFQNFITTVLIISPIIALCLACIYCYLRYTLRMGKNHEKYSGLTKHVPINEHYTVLAYLFVLMVNVLLSVGFVFCLNMIYLNTKKSFPWDTTYPVLRNLGLSFQDILQQPLYSSFIDIIEALSIFTLAYLTLSILLWVILACKEILPLLGIWLFIYGWLDGIIYNLEILSLQKQTVWHQFSKYLLPKVQFLVHILHPLEANYLFLIFVLFLFFLWQIYRNKFLRKKDYINLLFLLTLTFACIYPWNYKVGSFQEQFWLLQLYIGFAIFAVLPFLSVLLAFSGYRWRHPLKLVNLSAVLPSGDYSYFFWKVNKLLIVILLFIFINRIDIWKSNYSIVDSNSTLYSSTRNITKTIHDKENIALKIVDLFPLYEEIVKEYQAENPNTCNFVVMVGGCAGYSQCWTEFMKNEFPLPILVYNASKEYHKKYGSRITSKLHEILKNNVGKCQYPIDLKENIEYEDYKPYMKLSFFAGELILEALLYGVDGNIGEMVKILKEVSNLAKTIDENSRLCFHRYGIMGKLSWFCEWYLNHFELPEEAIWELKAILETIPLGNYEPEINNLKEERRKLFQLANSPKEYWMKFFDNNKPEGYRASWYAYPNTYFFEPMEKWLANIFIQKDLCNVLKEKYITVIDLIGLRMYERRETNECYTAHFRLWNFLSENNYIDYEQFKDLRRFTNHSNIDFPLEDDRERPYFVSQRIHRRIYPEIVKTGLAVELYRLKHGDIPSDLESLFPDYLEEIPCDPWNKGVPLTIRQLGDTGFLIYSYDDNMVDDAGVPFINKKYYPKMPRYEDIVFTLYPIEIRNQPVLSYEFPKKEKYEE